MAFATRGTVYKLPCCQALEGEGSVFGTGGLEIPLDDTLFRAVLRRGRVVQRMHEPLYVEAVSLWPHPDAGYIVFPMTLLQATTLEEAHPEFRGEGLWGEWRLRKEATDGGKYHLSVDLVRTMQVDEFWALVRTPRVNPAWIDPCYAPYRGMSWEQLKAIGTEADTDGGAGGDDVDVDADTNVDVDVGTGTSGMQDDDVVMC